MDRVEPLPGGLPEGMGSVLIRMRKKKRPDLARIVLRLFCSGFWIFQREPEPSGKFENSNRM